MSEKKNTSVTYSAFEPTPDLGRVMCLSETELVFFLHHCWPQTGVKHIVLNLSTGLFLRESGPPLSYNTRIGKSSWRKTVALLSSLKT